MSQDSSTAESSIFNHQTDKNAVTFKNPEDLSFIERHAVRHIRHIRDEKYSAEAFKRCHEFSDVFATCCAEHSFSSPWTCRSSLKELKACMNRQLVAFHEAEGNIRSLPTNPNQHVDYADLLDNFDKTNQKHQAQKQYDLEHQFDHK